MTRERVGSHDLAITLIRTKDAKLGNSFSVKIKDFRPYSGMKITI